MGDLGCVRDSVSTTPATVVGAYLTMVSAFSNDTAKSAAVASMRSFLAVSSSSASHPEELGANVATDAMARPGTSPQNATLAVWNAGLDADLAPALSVRAAVGAGVAAGAPTATFTALTELALSYLSAWDSVTSVAHGLLSIGEVQNDTATIAGILGAALDAASSKTLMQSLQSISTERRQLSELYTDAIAEAAIHFSEPLSEQEPGAGS